MSIYPIAKDRSMIGKYEASVKAGGGFVWDDLLEYRVWCHPHKGAPRNEDRTDYYHAFATYEEALEFSQLKKGCEQPLALILQEEFIDEPEPEKYIHVKAKRLAEWPVEFLKRPKRTHQTIPDFLSPNAPVNKLDILRGIVSANK